MLLKTFVWLMSWILCPCFIQSVIAIQFCADIHGTQGMRPDDILIVVILLFLLVVLSEMSRLLDGLS